MPISGRPWIAGCIRIGERPGKDEVVPDFGTDEAKGRFMSDDEVFTLLGLRPIPLPFQGWRDRLLRAVPDTDPGQGQGEGDGGRQPENVHD